MTEQAKNIPQQERGMSMRQKLARTGAAAMILAAAKFGVLDRMGTADAQPLDAAGVVRLNCAPPDYDAKPGETVIIPAPGHNSTVINGDIRVVNGIDVNTGKTVQFDNSDATGMIVVTKHQLRVKTPFGADITNCVDDRNGKLQATAQHQVEVSLKDGCVNKVGCSQDETFVEVGMKSNGTILFEKEMVSHPRQLKVK